MSWPARYRYFRTRPRAAFVALTTRMLSSWRAGASGVLAWLLRRSAFSQSVWRALNADLAWTPANNLAVGAEIMRRVRSIADPEGANRYLPGRWRRIFVALRAATAADIDWRAGPVFVNFGAGDRNPMGLPLLAALAGASRAIALEPGPIRMDVATATLQETLWDLLRDPAAYGLDVADLGRLRTAVDADALARGEPLPAVLSSGRLELLRVPGEASCFARHSIDLVFSRSVLEHVLEIETAMAQLVDALKPGGVMYHDIGLDAHDSADPLSLYYAERQHAQFGYGGLNGWRLSEYVALFDRLGCAVEILRTERLPPERLDRTRLVARYAARSDDDLLTFRAILLVRKSRSIAA